MKTIVFLFSFILTTLCSCSHNSDKDWQPTKLPHTELPDYVTRKVDNIKYTVHFSWSISEREQIISDTQKWMNQCLKLINETDSKDSLHIFIARNRNDMKWFVGGGAGLTRIKDPILNEDCIFSIYVKNGKYQPLKHELMHFITFTKWRNGYNVPDWLTEGIATYSDPEYYFNCDGLTLEERYAYLLQTGKLLDINGLMTFVVIGSKAAYNQSAYLVGYLIENFGVDKLKKIWITGAELHKKTEQELYKRMKNQNIDFDSEKAATMRRDHYTSIYVPLFQKIYGASFDAIIEKINSELIKKHPKPIEMDWNEFEKSCVE